MSINSHAFGRVVLTEADAVKFKAQVRYGRPKAAAQRSVNEGIKLSDSLTKQGSLKLRLKEPA